MQIEQRLPIGTSGGPVINLRGELVGVASSLAAIEGYERSGGFAIPIEPDTRWIIESLLAGREVEYGLLGVGPGKTALDAVLAERLQQPTAATVSNVSPGSPAALAELKSGDLIVAVDGQPTRSDIELMRQVTLRPPESVVQLTVYRRGTELMLKAKLGKWSVADDEGIVASERRYALWRGIAVDYPTARKRFWSPPADVPAAVVITEVERESAAPTARLDPGEFISHVNRTPVKTPAEFADAVKSLKGDVTLRLLPTRDSPGRTVIIKE
jgi:serine protease Do